MLQSSLMMGISWMNNSLTSSLLKSEESEQWGVQEGTLNFTKEREGMLTEAQETKHIHKRQERRAFQTELLIYTFSPFFKFLIFLIDIKEHFT